MRAGTLRQKIQIWKVESIRNEFNEQYDTYTFAYETRANVMYNSGARSDQNHEVFYTQTVTFEVRSYVDVSDFDHIKWNDVEYRIVSIQEDDNNFNYLQMKRIICEKINK